MTSTSATDESVHQPITPVVTTSMSAWEYVKEYCIKGPDIIREEFDAHKPHMPQSDDCTEWVQLLNRDKNRFSNVPCLDKNRVHLVGQTAQQSDFIHANYVDSFMQKEKFILTQAPPLHVMSDFWRMVWQEDVSVIVMLTRLQEHNKQKSSAYWPQILSETHRHDRIYVQNVARSEYPGIDQTELDVADDEDSSIPPEKIQRRRVHHMLYYDWPDHNMPANIPLLVDLLKKMNAVNLAEGNKKIIVHCSAGVGRGSVFVMLDILTQQCSFNGRLDITTTLTNLRKQRAMSVQTADQLCTLHMALLYFLLQDTKIVEDSRVLKTLYERRI